MLTFSSLKNQSDKSKGNSGEKNQGGVLGGLGYITAGLAAGIGSVGEGIIDLLLAGGGLLTGNVDYAKHVFKDNTVGNWFADVTEDFNPGTGWEFFGNVTHGLGQSSVFLLNLIPGLGQLGTAAFFAGVGSQGISSAAATTGDVGFKEVAYGVASGAVEGALEKAFGGMGKAVKALGGSTMKNITKTAVRKGLVKQVLSDAAGEFGEEFASEYIDTFLQRGFQIDPNKTTSLRDALYAGAVGFTSGAVSAGFANVLKAVGNEREGERVIKNGNSQTLVNTATKVADKLAAQGTNWDRAGEWVKALRGQVDAYSKLSESEKTGMRGKTILGEMKSSLFFAETQSTFDLVKKSIQNSDEQTRATFAEYINRSVEKGKRNGRDYTAADIAKDTDGVAWQLAIYKFVPSLFDLDGAIADMQQESEIADVVAKQGGAEQTAPMGAVPAMQFDIDENAVNSRSEAVEVEGEQTGAETVQDETAGASPRPTGEIGGQGEVIDGATSSSTVSDGPPSPLEKADLDRAKRDAERIIEWEKKEAPTVDELNRVRGAVKNFDSLSGDRQRAIVRMVRSGKNIDEGVIRGVSNIMAITNKKGAVLAPDVEIRFAEFGKDSTRRGIKTEVGGKTVIVLNANAKSTDILRGTIAHEIVHYLENRKGYKALAEYAMKHAKAEKVAKISETYAGVYEGENAEAKIEGEVVASVVAELLGSEKFLKRYAQMGEEQSSVVKKIARFVKGIANALKEKDEEAGAIARQMMELVDKALGSEVSGDKRSNDYIQFSLMSNDTLEESVDKIISMSDEDAIANKEAGNFISIAKKTPQVILDHVEGAENLEIVMRFDSFYLATRHEGVLDGHYHNYGNIMKQLPKIISDPQAIIRMDNGRINIYSQIQTKKGNNSIVSIELNTVKDINNKNNKYNLLVSVMPAKDNYAKNNLEKHGVKVEYEKEDLSQVNHQLHEWLATFNEKSSKDSIHQNNPIVNTFDEKSSDAAYMAAVERGDMETAQRMVDEAAKKAGYTVKAYHGTDNEFTVFDKNKIISNTGKAFYGTGFYFSTSEHDANNYGNKIMPVYLRVGKTLDLDSSTWTYDLGIEQKKSKVEVEKTHIEQAPKGFINLHYTTKDAPNIWKSISNVSPMQLTDDETGKKFVEKKLNPESSILPRDIKNLSELARNNGYNSIKGAGTNIGDIGIEYVLFDEENIKSADPVTYDDDGKVIPLSKRFNKSEPDIRYDLDPEAVEREAERLTPKTDVKGQEVSDEFFEAAVAKSVVENLEKAEGLYKDAINKVAELELEITRLENKNEAYAEGLDSKGNLLKEARSKRREAVVEAEDLREEIRNLKNELGAEKRKNARLEEQNQKQREMVRKSQKEQWKLAKQNADLINYKEYTIQECESIITPDLLTKYLPNAKQSEATYIPKLHITKKKIKEIARKLAVDLNVALTDTGTAAIKAANTAATRLVNETEIDNPYYDPENASAVKRVKLVDVYGAEIFDLVQKDIFNRFADIGKFSDIGKHNAQQNKIDKLNLKVRELQSELDAQIKVAEVEAKLRVNENFKLARDYAKSKAEIGMVFKETEIKNMLNGMIENGQVADFFEGKYNLNMSKEQLNAIARYIALELNILGTSQSVEAGNLIKSAAMDIAKKISFVDEESGKRIFLKDISEEETRRFVGLIRYQLQNMFKNIGTLNEFGEMQRGFEIVKGKFTEEKMKSKEQQEWGKEFPKTYQEALKMRSFAKQKKGVGSDSVQDITKTFAGVVDESGHIHYGKIDEAMKAAATFFEGEAMKLASQRGNLSDDAKIADESLVWSFNPELQEMVNYFIQLRQGREGKTLTSEELKIFRDVLKGMRTTLERYNKEYVNGKWVDVDIAAGETVLDMTRKTKSKTLVSKFLNTKVGKFINDVYFYEVLSPETVIESLEDFKTAGLLKTMYHDIRTSKQKAITRAARMKDPFKQFLDNDENNWKDEKGHKHSYTDKLNKKEIEVYGKKINLGEALYLYMLTRREQARLGLEETGYITYDDKGKEKTRVRLEDVDLARNQLISQFDETDKAFLKLAEQFFNETASKVKYDADMKIFGYSNNVGGYYVPIIRDRYSRMNGVTDMRQSASSIVTVYNKSFTKNVVRNNKALEGQNIMRIINDHADGLADYAELYLPLKAFDRIYNHGIVTEKGPTSIRQVLNTQKWNGTEKYFKKLFADIQGQSTGEEIGNIDKAVAWLRSGWVNSVLGANLKVVATQTTSLGAATQVIDARYVTKCSWMITPGVGYAEGVKAIADRADKYSDIIFARSFDMGALRAQGNIDKVTDLGRKTGSLIEWMDRKVCIALFHAAELQVEAQTGYKVGTEENATRAAKLADEAIYTTQSMDSKAEKSALQREKSEISKLFSMFTSDTVKNLSHLWGNFMKWNAHRNRVKNGEASYQAELKKDGRAIKRSLRTMAITGVMIGLITQGFKYLYGKEEEETEDKLKDFAVDITSSTLNVFPIVSEFVDKIFLDYDLSVNVLDVVNDTLDAVGGGFDVMGSVFAGEYVSDQKIVKTSANVLKSGASLFGIPVSPVERTVSGLLRRFFPSAIYGYDSMMSNPSYSADLQAAVESGDEALAEHILETIYKNEATGVYSTPELEEVARLYGLGNTSVIPQKIGATVNDVKLDRKQRAQFEKIYGEASAKVNELIRSEYYAELNDEQRAKAIKTLYSLYYNRAAAEVAEVEWSNAQAYSRLTDNYAALFAAQSYKSGLSPYKTLRGKEVSVKDQFVKYVENLGLSDADKLVVLYANGYRDAATKKKMLAYINSLSISEEEKTRIAERLGFALENGKVVEKKEELEVRAE